MRVGKETPMQESKDDKKRKYSDRAFGVLGILFLIGFIAACLCRPLDYKGFHIDQCQKMEDTFTVSWGDQETKTILPGMIDNPDRENIYLTTVLHKEILGKGDSILFRSRQSRAKVYLDGDLIFDSGEAFTKPFPMGYGSFWKSLHLGENYDGKTLTIELQPGYDLAAVSGYLPGVYFGTQASFISMILERAVWSLIPSLILILIGIYDMVHGLFAIHRKKAGQMLFLGLFAADTGLWMFIECHVLELFMNNLVLGIYLSYLTYGLMPVLLVRFLLSYEEFSDKIYLKVLYLLGIVLNLVQLVFAATGICSQFESQWTNRVYLSLTVLGLLAALFSIHKIEKAQKRKTLYSGVLILVVSTILELGYFVFVNKENSGNILRFGLCLFIFKVGIDVVREGKRLRREDFEKEILQTMAYTDGMTHLGNRFAYEQEKTRLEKQEHTPVIILVADMNGLKHANDNFGHAYGDQIICKTAELLEESFRDVGKCYRIGGDEFCVLAENVSRPVFEECRKTMRENVMKISNDIKVYSVASGVAEGESGKIDDIFREADNLMYDCKKAMKAGRS